MLDHIRPDPLPAARLYLRKHLRLVTFGSRLLLLLLQLLLDQEESGTWLRRLPKQLQIQLLRRRQWLLLPRLPWRHVSLRLLLLLLLLGMACCCLLHELPGGRLKEVLRLRQRLKAGQNLREDPR